MRIEFSLYTYLSYMRIENYINRERNRKEIYWSRFLFDEIYSSWYITKVLEKKKKITRRYCTSKKFLPGIPTAYPWASYTNTSVKFIQLIFSTEGSTGVKGKKILEKIGGVVRKANSRELNVKKSQQRSYSFNEIQRYGQSPECTIARYKPKRRKQFCTLPLVGCSKTFRPKKRKKENIF